MDEIHKQNILKKGGCVVQNCEWKLKENYFVKKKKKSIICSFGTN